MKLFWNILPFSTSGRVLRHRNMQTLETCVDRFVWKSVFVRQLYQRATWTMYTLVIRQFKKESTDQMYRLIKLKTFKYAGRYNTTSYSGPWLIKHKKQNNIVYKCRIVQEIIYRPVFFLAASRNERARCIGHVTSNQNSKWRHFWFADRGIIFRRISGLSADKTKKEGKMLIFFIGRMTLHPSAAF